MSTAVELRELRAAACQADRWTEGLPPPPPTHAHTIATSPRECTIPRQPAKPWDRGSDGDDSDEGVDSGEKLCGGGGAGDESDSTMETESECPTEIYVPGLLEKKPCLRGCGGSVQATPRLVGEVLPSVLSSSGFCSASGGAGGARQCGLAATSCSSPLMATAAVSARGRLIDAATAAYDDTGAMNIDSGISNETGGENATATSGDCGATGTVVLRRTLSGDADGGGRGGGGAADAVSLASSRYSSSYSCGSRGDAHPPMMLGQGIRERELKAHMKHQKRLRISNVLSGCYAITATALSIVLVSSSSYREGREAIDNQPQFREQHAARPAGEQQQQRPAAMYAAATQVFYMYLYTAGLVFLTYCYVSALRDRAVRRQFAKRKSRQTEPGRTVAGRPRRSPFAQAVARGSGRPLEAHRSSERQADVGSLFLRMCTAAFCVCCMVDNGIRFGVKVSSGCSDLLDALHPMAQMIFTFAQMYFIFVNSQMRLSRNVSWSKFGVAHLVATNISMWLHRLLQQPPRTAAADQTRLITDRRDGSIDGLQLTYFSRTAMAADSAEDLAGFNATSPSSASPARLSCASGGGGSAGGLALRDLLDSGEPYLTRLTVHYFLLSTALLFALWSRIGRATHSTEPPCAECAEHSLRRRLAGARTIDCRRTGLGLAAGALLLAAALGSLVAYYALRRIEPEVVRDSGDVSSSSSTPGGGGSSSGVARESIGSAADAVTAELLLACYQLAGCCLTLVVAVATLLKLARLDYNDCRVTSLEDALLGVGTAAVLARDIRSIATVAAALCGGGGYAVGEGGGGGTTLASPAPHASWLVVLMAACFDLLQTVVQSAAVALALRLRCRSSQDAEAKPGRQCISFLLAANLALWAACTFGGRGSTPSLPPELLAPAAAAGAAAPAAALSAWLQPLLSHAVEPAALAYRLIAAACLADVWHDLYRSPPTDIV